MKNFLIKYKIPIMFYLFVIFFANIPLLLGIDFMKWDIYDAHYPLATYMGDALKSGQLPLWNPMLRYGSPHYAMAGTPVWYPVTLILSLIGYSPWMMGFEYSLHRILAGFGMFLLIREYIKKEDEEVSIVVGIISGCIYSFSTVFVSNAQHIMIVISATWIPYVILYLKKYIAKNKNIYLLLSGGFAGLIMLGGYPEIFAGLFLCIMPYILYEYKLVNYNSNQSLILSIKSFVKLSICTMLASAVTVIPFIFSLNDITRGGNSNIQPAETSIKNLLTAIIPGISNKFNFIGDISMIYYYFTLLAIIILCVSLFMKKKETYLYLAIALFAFLMSLGKNFIIYSIFHSYVPLFNSFRFPTVWRCLVVVFLLIAISKTWVDLYKKEHISLTVKIIEKSILYLSIMGFSIFVVQSIVPNLNYNLMSIIKRIFISVAILMLYWIVFFNIEKKRVNFLQGLKIVLVVLCIEVLIFQACEFPITIGCNLNRVQNGKEYINNANFQYENRLKDMNFQKALRTNTHYHSTRDIIFNRTLDEDGYYSFKLMNTERYRVSANRFIKTQNPIVYYTNDIITDKKVKLKDWLNLQGVSNKQIFLNSNSYDKYIENSEEESFDSEIIKESKLNYVKNNNVLTIANDIDFTSNQNYRKIKLKLNTLNGNKAKIRFKSRDGVIISECDGFWDNKNKEIEIYFPSGIDIISKIEVEFVKDISIDDVLYFELKRAKKDSHIEITNFKLNNMSAKTNLSQEGVVVFQQAYYPGWEVYVDDKKEELLLIDGVFMGVRINSGIHYVTFKFVPKDFIVGAVISLSYLCSIIITFILWKRKKL